MKRHTDILIMAFVLGIISCLLYFASAEPPQEVAGWRPIE
jgi:hypothetical protein